MAAGPVCSVPVFEETEAIVLEEKVSTPGTETGPREQKHRRVSPRCPHSPRALALGTRRPRAQPASRLEPLEKGHPPPTTLSRLLDVPGLVPTGLSSSSFRAGRRPPLWSSCTLAGLRDPHSVPCDSATAPRLCPEHTELCLPSRVPAVCLAPSHRRLRHGFFSWTRSRSGARPDVSLP